MDYIAVKDLKKTKELWEKLEQIWIFFSKIMQTFRNQIKMPF